MTPYDPPEFLTLLAPQIVADIQAPGEIRQFTDNTDIIGKFVEESVRRFVRKYLNTSLNGETTAP